MACATAFCVSGGGIVAWSELPAGTREVLFRPEDTRIADAVEDGAIRGTVAAAFFLGDRTRLFVDVGEAQALVVESATRREFRHGDAIGLDVDPRGLLVL